MSLEQRSAQQKPEKPLIRIMDRMTDFGPSISYVLNYVVDRFRQGKTNDEIEKDMLLFIEEKRKYYLAKYS